MHADLIPTFGRLPLTHLRARHITAWSEAELARGRGRTAVYRIGATFSSALSHAVRTRVIVANPCRYVLPPRPVAPERICWNPAQAAAFLRHNHAHYGDQMADLFELLLGTGMRRGESLGLHWTDVHLAERMLLVRWSLTAVNNNHLYLGHPKTKASRNWVSLAPRAVAALERQAALARAGQPKGTPLEGLVFCRPDGSPLRPQGVLVELRRRADELGLPRIGVHDLRRTAATIMISSRVPLGSVFKDHRIVDHGWVIRRHELTDQEWGILAPLIPRAVTGRPRVSDRQVINGMVYKIRTGISWRDLPERYGPWQTVYTRFRRYALDGVFTRALQQIQARADAAGDIDWLVQIDSTIVRAHQHAAATGRKGGSTGRTNQTITPSVDPEEA